MCHKRKQRTLVAAKEAATMAHLRTCRHQLRETGVEESCRVQRRRTVQQQQQHTNSVVRRIYITAEILPRYNSSPLPSRLLLPHNHQEQLLKQRDQLRQAHERNHRRKHFTVKQRVPVLIRFTGSTVIAQRSAALMVAACAHELDCCRGDNRCSWAQGEGLNRFQGQDDESMRKHSHAA
jgi:hypothetical protein